MSTDRATQDLVAALRDVASIDGFARGLEATIRYTEQHLDLTNPSHFEAEDALTVWRPFLALVTAVQADRKGSIP